jgi:Tfp pilus assembly protein FimT
MFELLLVLGILLAITAIVWPRVHLMYERHRLQSGVENMRAHLAGTRLRAIETGVIYQFVYEPGGQSFEVLPLESSDGTSLPTVSGRLPDNMQFEAAEVTGTTTITDPDGIAQSNLAAPILFAPDGSATDAAFNVSDDENQFVRLSVRGLTAAVSMSNIQQRSSR